MNLAMMKYILSLTDTGALFLMTAQTLGSPSFASICKGAGL